MLFISYRGIYDGNNFEDANTPKQIQKAISNGFNVMMDVWKEGSKFYLGNDQPITEVSEKYLQNKRFWLNARNTEMQNYLTAQPHSLYPNYFWFVSPMPPPPYVVASNGKLITPGTVPINNNSVIYLPEISDTAMFSTVNLKCYGITSSYLTFIRRMRNEGAYY
jgi:hypothetical protein